MVNLIEQPVQARRSDTTFAICVWVLTILMGSSGIKEPVIFLAPAATPLLTLVWLALYACAAAALLFNHQITWLIWLLRYRLMLSIALLGVITSALWAVDPALSLQRSIHLLGCGVLAIYIGFSLSLPTLLKTLLWTASALVLISLIAVFALPELSVQAYEGERVWRGVFANKNTLGFWCTMTVALAICLLHAQQSWPTKLAICFSAVICLVALFESKSATSQLALLTALSVAAILSMANKLKLGLAQQALLGVLGAATVILLVQTIDTHWLNSVLGRSGNLTGRGEVWAQTWSLILDRPLVGYGYGNLWNPTDETLWIQQKFTHFSWIVYHAHNGLLQIASELGLIITTIVVVFVLQQILESLHFYHQQASRETLFIIVYSVAFLLGNYSEARMMIDRDLFWVLFLAMPISLLQHPTAIRNPAHGMSYSAINTVKH